jgi:hypothetical protein
LTGEASTDEFKLSPPAAEVEFHQNKTSSQKNVLVSKASGWDTCLQKIIGVSLPDIISARRSTTWIQKFQKIYVKKFSLNPPKSPKFGTNHVFAAM